MSFATDLAYLMTNDSSLNSWCDGGIHYENLPENFEITKDWIVYSFNKTGQNSCLDSQASFTEYAVIVKIVGNDTVEVETVNDYLVEYLNGNSYNGIQDIIFTGDIHTLDLDKNIYMNTLNFNALYV